MRLINLVNSYPRRLVIPLMGYPGTQLTNTTLKQNVFNWGIQFWSISELAELCQPDAIFFMMDLSVEAGALGVPVRYPLEDSPTVEQHLVQEVADLEQFMCTDILKDGRVTVFLKTMELMSQHLDMLKGAYCIGPFTLAGLLTGASEIAMATIDRPEFLHEILNFCTQVITKYAVALVDSGADIVAILEPTAVFLSPNQFEIFSGNYIKKIVRAIHAISVLHICGDSSHLIEKMCETGVEALSLDSLVNFKQIACRMKNEVILMGNLDPVRVVRNLSVDEVKHVTQHFLAETREIKNLILSTGCDLPQDTPLANIQAMIEIGKKYQI
ncbi:MAG: uroporphyrinogen decarboxylase family protein [bacterium]|nr:uroporphyrinogen decarboxylase family protein [bacterium]